MAKKYPFQEIGENVTIYSPVTLIQPEKMVLKNHILISEYAYLAAGLGLYIGNFIHISAQSIISGGGSCFLDDFVGLSAGVRIITGSDDLTGRGLTNPTIPAEFRSVYRSFVHCQKHSVLATSVIVYPGVTIGEGSVVGSGSVVSKDLEPWGFYMGYPARRIKDRPKEKILELEERLLSSVKLNRSDFSDEIHKATTAAKVI